MDLIIDQALPRVTLTASGDTAAADGSCFKQRPLVGHSYCSPNTGGTASLQIQHFDKQLRAPHSARESRVSMLR